MYPFLRMFKELALASRKPPLNLMDEHVSTHLCWPWDLDIWNELNNGRTLTLYDLGRIPMAHRSGLTGLLRARKWGIAIAGASVRYRRRVKMFDKITMRSRLVGWDERFIYIEQSMWKTNGDCASHALFRSAVTDRSGIVSTDRVLHALGITAKAPEMPDWILDWFASEEKRPWPPMQST